MLNVSLNTLSIVKPLNKISSTVAPLEFQGLKQDVFVKTISFNGAQKTANEKTIEFYEKNAQSYFDSTKNLDVSEVYDKFLPFVPKNGTILDAGCGSGRDSKHFKEKGYKVIPFDASSELARLSSEYIGQPVLVDTFQNIKLDKPVDAIWAFASLLHLEKQELDGSIKNLLDNLKPGGVMLACFKQGDGELVDAKGRQFINFTEKGLKKYIEKSPDVEIEKLWKTGDSLNRNDTVWLNVILKKV